MMRKPGTVGQVCNLSEPGQVTNLSYAAETSRVARFPFLFLSLSPFLLALSGCLSVDNGPETGGGCGGHYGRSYGPPTIPGMQGARGEKVPVAAPYHMAPPATAYQAQAMMSRSVPMDTLQLHRGNGSGSAAPPGFNMPPTIMPVGGMISPLGVPFGPGAPGGSPVPPGAGGAGLMPRPGIMQSGMVPGMNPGGGVMPASFNPALAAGEFPPSMPGANPQGDVIAAAYPPSSGFPTGGGLRFPVQRTQVRFVRPSGMEVAWYTVGPDGKPSYSNVPIHVPGRYNFLQGAVYRLKLSKIEGRPGLELYPTLEVVPVNPKTEAFLSHSSVPIEFTGEDFKQIAEGNYVVKVIYLPDPQFQDVAGTGTDEILSTRLEPGADPITEALRRGSILLVIRMGNMHQELDNTPPINAGPGAGRPPLAIPGVMVPPPGAMMPYGPTPGLLVGPGSALDPGSPWPPAQVPGPRNPAPGFNDVRMPPTPGPSEPPSAGSTFPPPEKSITLPPTPELKSTNPGLPPVDTGANPAPPVVSGNPDNSRPAMLPPPSDVAGPANPPPKIDSAAPPADARTGPAAPKADVPPVVSDPTMPNLPPLPDPGQPIVLPGPAPSMAPSTSYLPPANPRSGAARDSVDPLSSLPPTIFDTLSRPPRQ